jgi:hypothetical protein
MAKQKLSKAGSSANQASVSSSPSFFKKNQTYFHIGFIAIVFYLIYSWIYNPEFVDLNGDNFAYYVLGKVLSEGKGYINVSSVIPLPQTHFPPGFPVIIAACIKLFNADMNGISVLNGLFYFISIVIFYFTMNKIQPSRSLSFVVSIFLVFNVLLLGSAMVCMSEIPFILFSTIGVFFLVRSSSTDKLYWQIVLAALFFAASYYTRSIGIGLFGALVIYLLFSKRWIDFGVAIGTYVIAVIPWVLRGKSTGGSYSGQFMQVNPYKPELGNLTLTTFIERIQNNLVRYLSLDIPKSVFNLDPPSEVTPTSFWLIGIGVIILAFWGIYKLKDFKMFFIAYLLAVGGILLVWPDAFGGLRFIESVLPILLFLLAFGITQLINLGFQKLSLNFSPYWLLIALIFSIGGLEELKEYFNRPLQANYRNYFELAKWAKANTPPDAVFSARKPDMFRLYSERLTIGDKPSLNDTVVLDFFRENGVDYVVLEQLGFSSTAKYLYPAIQKNPDKFPVVSQLPNPDTYILKFIEGDR